MRHSLDDAGVIYIYINIMIYMFRMSGCRCSPRRPIPMPRDGDDTDQRAEPVATSVQFQGLLSIVVRTAQAEASLQVVVETIFDTRVELDDRGTNGGQIDDDVPNPTFSEWSDKLHEAEEIVRKVKADIHRVHNRVLLEHFPRVILDVEPREDRAKEKRTFLHFFRFRLKLHLVVQMIDEKGLKIRILKNPWLRNHIFCDSDQCVTNTVTYVMHT